jgi:quinol monooxygenase YgiN
MSSSDEDVVSFNGPVGLNPRFVVKSGEDVQKVIDALKIDQIGVYSNEPGSIQFVFGLNVDDPTILNLHEKFRTKTDLSFHNDCEHMDDIKRLLNIPSMFDQVDIPIYTNYRPKEGYNASDIASKISNTPGRYCLNVTSYVKEAYRNEFIRLMILHQQSSLLETQCIQFDWGVSTTDPNIFHQHEQFEDRAGLDYHTTTDHFATFMRFNKQEPYTKTQDVYHFVLL